MGEEDVDDQSLFSVVEDVYRKLNFQATHDALTGCMHRHDFEKQISGLISAAPSSPEDSASALLVLDIDEFSVINASYGAQAGDTLLISGKGHETGQIVGDKILPFNEPEIVQQHLKAVEA